jgi:GAF domain-containing protein/anti-sigma regulatory factor (Ser/Thr protein kinase)
VSGAEDTSLSPAHRGGAGNAAAPAGAAPRRRLFRKYALLFIALVGAALLVNSTFDFWFSYEENKASLVRIQQEKADAAARRIEEFIGEIERQIGWTTHAQWASGPLDQRRQDYFRLLRQEPPITELSELDGEGKEQLQVSRLKMDVVGSAADFSQTPAFMGAKAKRTWFSPVYFRKESEPYMTLAMAREGRKAGVTIAEINLKLIWDVITGLKIGKSGYAYVVDEHGRLIAHPDISLVLRDTDLSKLPQVAEALTPVSASGGPASRGDAAGATLAQNLGGHRVLTAHAAIQPVGWQVFVEVPLVEAFAPLYGAAMRTGALLLFGLIAATLIALVIARRMTGPIRAITEGAERIGAGEFERRIDIHTGDELEALAEQFNRMGADLQKSYAELEQRVADRTAELSESLDQQTATAEVLGVINSSPGDLAPVFDAMLEKALNLCDAIFGVLWTYDGERVHVAAHRGEFTWPDELLRRGLPTSAEAVDASGRLLRGEPIVHIADITQDIDYSSANEPRRLLLDAGARSLLAVPLWRDTVFLGYFAIYRREVRPFTDKQIALLQNFGAQAEIAMENARLIIETREALDQQTATAEVLGVINSSPGELAPVFDAMLEKAMDLCGAAFGALQVDDGDRFRTVATFGVPPAFAEYRKHNAFVEGPGSLGARIRAGERVVHVLDLKDDEPYRTGDANRRSLVNLGGARTGLAVPLVKDVGVLGFIILYRQEVRPFTDKQIALLQNFAAQAVIAMENARLITETREALEQQTATAEVLGVINSSPGDLAPVFDAMLERAMRLCDAAFGGLWMFGDRYVATALRGVPQGYADFLRGSTELPGPGTGAYRFLHGERSIIHNLDLADEEPYRTGQPGRVALVDLGGARTALQVPLCKDETPLGLMTIYRQEVRPFTDKQIALLQNFAAQAVIAMENARLITETREALDQQTATSEVLQVINSSPGDLVPVFDAMLEKAMQLCGAAFGEMQTYDGERFQMAALRGLPPRYAEFRTSRTHVYGPGTIPARLLAGERPVHVLDITAEDAYRDGEPNRLALADLGGARTVLAVPLLKEGAVIGFIVAYRQEVRPFSDKQIALLQNFAAQAVIAMENARLLTETRDRTRDLQESLEYQTATSDVLKVISRSVFDLDTVLQTVVATAIRLCRADTAIIYRNEGGEYRWAAGRLVTPEYEARERMTSIRPGTGTVVGRAALEGRTVQILDAWTDPLYEAKEDARVGGVHTMIGVPLLREGLPIGVIGLARMRVEPFTDKQIELVSTFADQAVIAIENARLVGELRERTDELARSVEELKALGEVGQEVSSSLDLRHVLVTILNRSVSLTGSDAGAIFRYSRAERAFHFVEAAGYSEAMVGEVRDLNVGETMTALGDAIAKRAPLQIGDLRTRPPNPLRDSALAAGFRSVLLVPLVGADRIMGVTILQRRAVGEFPEATVRLMQTLASQSVLAIQNARLFREIADKSEQLALASEHKSQFLANMSHELRTPLNAILGYTELMVDGIYGELPARAAGVLERVQNNGKHLLALINDVLDLAKIEAGQLTMQLDDYAMPDVVHSVVSATEALASTKGLKFTADIMAGLPPGRGDARRLAQVLLNLVGNAVKFTDEGEVAIGAMAENGHFVLTVRDTGPGIAPADQDRIFGEFQQIDNSNTRKKGGTGLGLAISKRMVEMQGGTISVESEVGQGSTFRVVLPVRVEGVGDELTGELMGAAQ